MTEESNNAEVPLAIVVDVWKHIVSVQMHFNEISMKVRNLYFTIVAASLALIGVMQGRKIELPCNLEVHLVMFVMFSLIPISYLFYFIDRYWYHRLLQGSVKQAAFIEEKYRYILPEIQLGSKISKESPVPVSKFWQRVLFFVKDKRLKSEGKLHSDEKIAVMYKSVVVASAISILIYGVINGVQIDGQSIFSLVVSFLFGVPTYL